MNLIFFIQSPSLIVVKQLLIAAGADMGVENANGYA
jgi:hypothetical protein